MNGFNIKVDKDNLIELFSKKEGLGGLLEQALNQVLETQMSEHLGADKYEHNQERQGYRNGYRTRQLYTRIGPLNLRVPQTRDGSFCTEIFKRYQRHEQAFVLGLMEMYLQGVSTRKVSKITEALCGVSFSKSTVSQLCLELDLRLNAWRARPLSTKRYPFLIVDALVIDIRRDEAVRASGCLIAYGVNEDSHREPLDLLIADSESQSGWDELFAGLKNRGLEDAITVLQLPTRYQQRLRTSNLAERVNEEIRRRQRVIRIFPNEKAAERLIGAWLADLHEQWQAGVKYFDMQEFWDWKNEEEEERLIVKAAEIVAIG